MRNKLLRGATISMVILCGIMFIACGGQGNKDGGKGDGGQQQGGNENLPPKQVEFVKTVESFIPGYKAAPNELKKSALRADRRQAIERILGGNEISDWVGTLVRMGTNSEGKAHLEIKLNGGTHVTVKTWNNALSDASDNTLIDNGSPLYKTISELANGNSVIFSGVFVQDKKDFIRESSVTESGSMNDPAFIIRFSEVKRK